MRLFTQIMMFILYFVTAHALSPVVMIPGLAGSVFKAKLDGADAPHFWCKKNADWFVTWLNLEQLIPEQKDCLLSRLALNYDEKSDTLYNAKGVMLDTNVDFGTSFRLWCNFIKTKQIIKQVGLAVLHMWILI